MSRHWKDGLTTLDQAFALAHKKYPCLLHLKIDILVVKADILKNAGRTDGYFETMEQMHRLQSNEANCNSSFMKLGAWASTLGFMVRAESYDESLLPFLESNIASCLDNKLAFSHIMQVNIPAMKQLQEPKK